MRGEMAVGGSWRFVTEERSSELSSKVERKPEIIREIEICVATWRETQKC